MYILPKLLFNADETEVNRKGCFKGKVATKSKKQPCIAARDRSGSHASLFIIVSAAGSVVEPTFLLHGKPERYVSDPSLFEDKLVCVHTKNGYMDKGTFKSIMVKYFIPYVNRVRDSLGSTDRAALVVDGHLSRYDIETFRLLREAGIDLIILPAHSSHITQPLDRNLNGLIKRAFPAEYRKGVPKSVLEDMECLRQRKSHKPIRPAREYAEPEQPAAKRRRTSVGVEDATQVTKNTSAGKKASSSKKQSHAAMERLCTLYALLNVMTTLKARSITSSWTASGLHPFTGLPPITREKADRMLREKYACDALSGKAEEPRNERHSITITGLVNTEEGMRKFEQLLQHKQLKPSKYRGKYQCLTTCGNRMNRIDIVNENEDVGDYVTVDPGTDATEVYGLSDAECFVTRRKRRVGRSIHSYASITESSDVDDSSPVEENNGTRRKCRLRKHSVTSARIHKLLHARRFIRPHRR